MITVASYIFEVKNEEHDLDELYVVLAVSGWRENVGRNPLLAFR